MKKFFTRCPWASLRNGSFALLVGMLSSSSRAADIVNEPLTGGSLPAGWTQTNVTFPTTGGGYARFHGTNSVLTSPVIDLSGYTGVALSFDVAKFGSGENGPITVEFSTDGGSTWTAQTFDSPTPTDNTYLTSGPTTITAGGATVQFRFTRASSPSEKRLRNVLLTGTLSATSVAFASTASSVAENGGSINLALTIINPSAVNATTVTIAATGATGRISGFTTPVTFPAGSSANQNVAVTISDNTLCDGDEDVVFTITGASGGSGTPVIGANNAHTLTITNDESLTDPVAIAATGIQTNQFTANWNAVNGATGYYLDVSTSPTFGLPAATMIGWDFEDQDQTADSGLPVNSANQISTTADGPITYTQGAGGAGNAITSEGWDGGSGSKYWLVNFAATGYSNLTVSSKQRSSNSGPEDFQIQYRIGTGGTWTDVPGGTITVANNFSSGVVSALPLPAACDNQPDVYLRWIMTTNQRVGSGTVAATGTSRIDDISIDAPAQPDLLPGYNDLPVAGTSQAVTGLVPGTTYYYRVRSTGGCSSGLNSNTITTTTLTVGCTDPLADNYDSNAGTDDGSCTYCAPTITYNAPTPTPITIGSGIPDQNMAVAVDCHNFKVAMNAFERYVGAIIPTGNVYTTTTGYSPTNGGDPTPDPNNARWNFLVSIDLGTYDFTQVQVYLDMDFDPGTTPVFQTVDISALAISQGQGASHIQQQSQNLKSAFWALLFPGVSFDANVPGTYDLRVRMASPTGAALWNDAIQVVVEAPGCMDPLADNYNAAANVDDGSCTYCAPTITYNQPTPTPITIGSGIPDQNMAASQDCRGIDVALSAFERYVGPIIPAGNVYATTTGHSPTSGSDPTPDPVLARWNLLGSIDLGTFDFTEVNVFLDLDFDPGSAPIWNTMNLSQGMINNGMGALHVYQASENLAAGYWTIAFPGVTFDPNVPGTYDVRVRLESAFSNEPLVTLAIQVVVDCAPHAGNVWYVNDASTAGDVYTTAAGSDSNSGTASCPFGTMAYAVSQASAGDTILVDAGTYVENLLIDKAVDLRGAQYGADPNTRTGAESIIHPAVSDPDPYSATASVIIYVNDNSASGTKINGFTVDGDNPALTSGVVFNGADMDAIEAIASYTGNSNLDIAYNILKNVSYAGVDLDNYGGTGIVNGLTVRNNLFQNITSTSWGVGTILQYNAYADITDNTMTQVRVGIQTGNHTLPNSGPNPSISGNTITSYRLGIFHNVQYTNASPFQITGNNLLTETGSPNNTGIFIGVLDPTVIVTLQNNNVTGAANGVMMWGASSSVPVTLEGGTLTDCGIGVFVNNYDAYPLDPDVTHPTSAVVKDVIITGAGTGIHVKDNMLNTHAAATVHVSIEGTTSVNVDNGGINVLVTGSKASLSFAGSDVDLTGNPLRYIRLESNGSTVPATDIDATQVQFNGATATTATGFAIEDLIDHKPDLLSLGKVSFVPGELFVTPNSFVTPNTVGSVQRGIDAAAINDIVHVNDGTYNEDVNVNKVVTVQGNDRDLTILRGLYGTTAAALSIGANATVKDLTSTRDYGADLSAWQSSPKTNGVSFTGNNGTLDNVLVSGHRNAVYINNRQNSHVLNCIIEDNRTGIHLVHNVDGTVITNNFIRDNFTMGLLFNFDFGAPDPSATGMLVNDNSFSGNWYGEVSFQGTPLAPISGYSFNCNWYGTTSPVASATPTGEPGYATQVPSQFGGTAPTPPAGQIMGLSASLVNFQPFGHDGTDDDTVTPGFQPVPGNCDVIYYSQATGNVSDPIWDVVPVGTAGAATFTATASMVVQNGHSVTNTTDADVKNLTVDAGGALAINGGTTLTVHGDEAIFDGTLTAANTSTLNLAGTDATIIESTGGPLDLWNLTVNTPQGTLTDATIGIRGTLQLDGGEFDASLGAVTLSSTASGTGRLGPVASGASYTGDLTVQRYIPAGHTNWRMLASPVAGRTVSDWQDDFITAGYPGSQYPNFDSPTGSGILWPSVRLYNEANTFALADSGVVGVGSSAQALVAGQGFLAWSGDDLFTTQAFTMDVTGAPTIAQSPLTLPMSFTSSGTAEADGWNLVANPLPSPIDFTLLSRGADVENAYWIFDPVSGNNRAWTNGVGQGGLNGKIQSSQGFWVKADGTNVTTTVDESAKVNQPGGGTFGGDQDPLLPILNLTIASNLNTYSDEATIAFTQGTPAYDNIDALKMTFKTIGAPQIGIMSSDGRQLAVDFFGSYTTAVQIPLKVDVDVTGTYTITAAMAGITGLSCLSLTDLQTGTVTPLTDGAAYSCTINANADANITRFVLNGSALIPFYNEPATCFGQEGLATVVVNNGPVNITWTDVFGNVLLQQTVEDGTAEFDALAGNYQVHITPGGACGELATDFTITAPDAIGSDVLQTATSCPSSTDGSMEIATVTGGTAPYTFLWNTGATANSITGAAGSYSATITDAAGCTSSINAEIPAGEGAIAQFSFSGGTLLVNTPVQFTNSSVLADSYTWDFGDGSTSMESDPAHTYTLPGTYTVTLTANGGACTSVTTQQITVELNTAIASPNNDANLAVWATPDHLVVQHPFGSAPVDVAVFDATGKQVISTTAITKPVQFTLNDRSLSTGVWFVRVTSGEVQRTFRVPLVR